MEQNSSEFFNLYIERILNEVGDLTKAKLIMQTQLAWNEKTINEMTELQNKLQQANNDLQAKLRAVMERKTKNSGKVIESGFAEAETQ